MVELDRPARPRPAAAARDGGKGAAEGMAYNLLNRGSDLETKQRLREEPGGERR
jgi:hypothetical protein